MFFYPTIYRYAAIFGDSLKAYCRFFGGLSNIVLLAPGQNHQSFTKNNIRAVFVFWTERGRKITIFP